MVLPWTTFLVSNGYNIVTCNFVRFAANDVKGNKLPLEMEQVVHDNMIWTLKTWSPNFHHALVNW